jgi:hypothetical protein
MHRGVLPDGPKEWAASLAPEFGRVSDHQRQYEALFELHVVGDVVQGLLDDSSVDIVV